MSNNEQLALIIGGTTGMGKATADRLLRRGVSVGIVGRNRSRLDATRDELAAHGSVEIFEVDLYDTSAVQSFIDQIEARTTPINYLVNAAGTFNPKPFLEHTSQDYDSYLDLNKATFFITQAVARNMAASGGSCSRSTSSGTCCTSRRPPGR